MTRSRQFFLALILVTVAASVQSQDQLSRQISVDFNNISYANALINLNGIEDINLSYSPAILPDGLVNKSYINVPINSILIDVLGKDYDLKIIGNYIIILKKKEKNQPKKTFQISGGIVDAETGNELEDVTIYEINTLNSTLSDEGGTFDLTVSAKTDVATFAVSRVNYKDTIIQVSQLSALDSTIVLTPKKEVVQPIGDSLQVENRKLVQLFTTSKNIVNTENVDDYQKRPFQVSFLPAVGTNMKMGGSIVNNFSLNALAGYSYGLKGVEIGGLYNIDRKFAHGLQVGGLGNTVGGNVKGAQIGGLLNTSSGNVQGTQIGGLFNNSAGKVDGAQIAGIFNMAKSDFTGIQLSGLGSSANKLSGTQINGLTGYSSELTGLQLSGFSNHVGEIKGVQLGGFLNTAGTSSGLQLSGFLNVTKVLKGVQFSVINFADSVASGIPIGLINIVAKDGYLEPAFEYSDVIPYRVSLRTGLKKFYSVLSLGTQSIDTNNLFSYGFGFGSQINLYKRLFTSVELRTHGLQKQNNNETRFFNLLNRFHLNIGIQAINRLSITAGPVLNVYLAGETFEGSGVYGYDISNNPFYDQISNNVRVQMWMGYSASIRF